jgi:hypothetical protein
MPCTMIIESHDRPALLQVFRYGLWSATLATIVNVGSTLALLGFLLIPGTRLDLVSDALGFLVAALFLVLVVSIQHAATKEQRMITHLGLIFAVLYLLTVSTNYYLQLTVVRHLPVEGGAGLPAVFASVFLAMETLGYGFLGVATLWVAPVFSEGRLESAIRWLFIANGVLGVLGILVYPLDVDARIIFGGLFVWDVIFPLSLLLLAVFFRRQIKDLGEMEPSTKIS